MNRLLLIAPALTIIGACEADTPAPLAREQFALTRATSVCSGASARCATVGVTGIDESACTAKTQMEWQTSLDEDLARPNATYDPIAAARCARTSRARIIETDLDSDSDLLQCLAIVGGLGDYGWLNFHSACLSDAGCAPGYFCYHGIDGRLAPLGWCKRIGATSEEGRPCNATRSDNGDRITYDWAEIGTCYESDGLFCGGSEDNRTCMRRAELGASCSDTPCVYATVCRPNCNDTGCAGQTCQLPGNRGEVCHSNDGCVDGLRCSAAAGTAAGTCQPRLEDGAACSEREDCASGFCSYELGVCASALRADCESIARSLAD